MVSKNSKSLICRDIDEYLNGYFSGGKLFVKYINSKKEEYIVNSHFANKIELRDEALFKLEDIEEIKLSPTCDKKIRTCCYSFNNTVNFRGEPDIPEYRIIKN